MRFTFLSMPALCALLVTASPVEKREPKLSHASFDIISASASASGLSKRFSLLRGGTVTINGKVYPPGSQPFPGVFVAGPGAPVCESYCLNVGVAADFKAQCAGRGCPDTEIAINPNAFYVLPDGVTAYKGDTLTFCPTGGICLSGQTTPIDITQPLPATT